MCHTAFFGIIYGSHSTISTNFYLYRQYFQQKIFNFSKISGSQTDHSVGLVGGVGKVGIENCGMMKKWEDIKYFIFSLFCLVGSGKVEKWKKRI